MAILTLAIFFCYVLTPGVDDSNSQSLTSAIQQVRVLRWITCKPYCLPWMGLNEAQENVEDITSWLMIQFWHCGDNHNKHCLAALAEQMSSINSFLGDFILLFLVIIFLSSSKLSWNSVHKSKNVRSFRCS